VQLVPHGYTESRIGTTRVVARDDVLEFVLQALARSGTLYDYAAQAPEGETIQGRGTIHTIPGPGSERWVVRHLSHGGLLAAFTGDRFLRAGVLRPLNELLFSVMLQELGVPTPAVVAAVVYPAGPSYRGDVAREEITDALDLAACLFGPQRLTSTQRAGVLAEAGRLFRSIHRAGVIHPDLNIRNVLVRWSGRTPQAYILDIEKCRTKPRLSKQARNRMLSRFRRSARKFEKRTGQRIGEEEWEVFSQAYLETPSGGGSAPRRP